MFLSNNEFFADDKAASFKQSVLFAELLIISVLITLPNLFTAILTTTFP